jgi:predicted small integral membrane protein
MSWQIEERDPAMIVRISKSLLVLAIGLFAALAGYNNIVDYGSNFEFVRHVMLMDTTFPENALMSRAISDPILHQVGYWIIIGGELATGALCLVGASRLLANAFADGPVFSRAKPMAVAGLTVGFCLWFVGFMTIGAEWFLMWQSETWNGQQAAFRFIACIGLVLVVLLLPEQEQQGGAADAR